MLNFKKLSMICVAISDNSLEKCMATLEKVQMAEIRIDLTGFGPEAIKAACSHSTPTVATCRADNITPEKQLELLTVAIQAGAKYVDIEIEAGKEQIDRIAKVASENNCKLIVSYHNYQETPGLRDLYKIVDECYKLGADVAKVATQANSTADCARILSLYSTEQPLVALGMGKLGKITRLIATQLGAEFTFASMDDGAATASGQIGYSKMVEILQLLKKELD